MSKEKLKKTINQLLSTEKNKQVETFVEQMSESNAKEFLDRMTKTI